MTVDNVQKLQGQDRAPISPGAPQVIRQAEEGRPLAVSVSLPLNCFQGYGGDFTPRVLRPVDSETLLYVVREGYEESDVSLLDRALEIQGGPIVRKIIRRDGSITDRSQFAPDLIVQVVAAVRMVEKAPQAEE